MELLRDQETVGAMMRYHGILYYALFDRTPLRCACLREAFARTPKNTKTLLGLSPHSHRKYTLSKDFVYECIPRMRKVSLFRGRCVKWATMQQEGRQAVA